MGSYENNFCNPIITHRHLGKDSLVRYVGHANLVETVYGDWYIVMLAVRPENGYSTLREGNILVEVIWEDDWPVVNLGKGLYLFGNEHTLKEQEIKLSVKIVNLQMGCELHLDYETVTLAKDVDIHVLSTEVAGGGCRRNSRNLYNHESSKERVVRMCQTTYI